MFMKTRQGPSELIAASLAAVTHQSVSPPADYCERHPPIRIWSRSHTRYATAKFGPFNLNGSNKGFRRRVDHHFRHVNGDFTRRDLYIDIRSTALRIFRFLARRFRSQMTAASVRIERPEIDYPTVRRLAWAPDGREIE